jgi:Na+(H+)/acetate symporter ActP
MVRKLRDRTGASHASDNYRSIQPDCGHIFPVVRGQYAGFAWWAAKRTRTTKNSTRQDAASPASRTGWHAGDYMSAASFLGIAVSCHKNYDRLIYSVGWLVGWPIVMF